MLFNVHNDIQVAFQKTDSLYDRRLNQIQFPTLTQQLLFGNQPGQ